MSFKFGFSCTALVLLSACGGSVSNQEFVDNLIESSNATEAAYIEGKNVLQVSDLPVSTTANYTGILTAFGGTGDFEADTDEVLVGYIGELDLTANFLTDSIEGTADNFVNITNADGYIEDDDPVIGGDVEGTLTFTGDLAATDEAAFELLVSGELSGPDGSNLNFDEVGGAADVYGPNAEAIEVVGGTTVIFDDVDGFIGFYGVAEQ